MTLHNPLTTPAPGIGKVATMPKRIQRPAPTQIYGRRQPRRPHYLADLMERHGITRSEIIEAIGVDKSLLSRWLDQGRPTTPTPMWAARLGEFFGRGGDPVDIFADPDVDWMSRFFEGRNQEEVARMKAMLEAAFPAKRTG